MFLSPKIWGCKYTNNFLFINKKAVFQHFGVLITSAASDRLLLFFLLLFSFSFLFPLSIYSFHLLPHFLSPPSTTFLLHTPFFKFLSPYPFLHIPFLHIPFSIFFHSAIFCHFLGSGRCPSSCSAIYHSSPYRHHTDHLHQTDTILTGTIRRDTILTGTIQTDRQSLGRFSACRCPK